MPDEHRGEPYYRTERAFWPALLLLLALAFGAMGTCGVISAVDSVRSPENELAPLGLMIGLPSALLGLGGVYFCLRALWRRYHRRP